MTNLRISDGSHGDVLEEMKWECHSLWSSNEGKFVAAVKDRDGNVIAKGKHETDDMAARREAIEKAAAAHDYKPKAADPVDAMKQEMAEMREQLARQSKLLESLQGGRPVSADPAQPAAAPETPPARPEKVSPSETSAVGVIETDGDEDDDGFPPPPPPPEDIEEEQTASEVLGKPPKPNRGRRRNDDGDGGD